jgi:hypothetical protein
VAKKLLQIIEGAYRVNTEEQDDPAVWVAGAMAGSGGSVAVLLRGNAVNYAVRRQDASGLAFGAWKQTQPPAVAADLERMIAKGIEVLLVEEDAAERGLERSELIGGLTPVSRTALPAVFERFDLLFHW